MPLILTSPEPDSRYRAQVTRVRISEKTKHLEVIEETILRELNYSHVQLLFLTVSERNPFLTIFLTVEFPGPGIGIQKNSTSFSVCLLFDASKKRRVKIVNPYINTSIP